ncbi:AMIN-like domain-containing (lipo)protein [Lentzea sp. CA-135723]|uniref:AMIN-like domain-containing (lipo)protein n=1 Tax=Lentzea sp. CA-135723 TaxID=3239950 RepID=UPI003D89D965
MKRRLGAVLLAVAAVFTAVPVASASGHAELTNIRTGKHQNFERIVLDMNGLPSNSLSREATEVSNCASGNPVPLAGTEILETMFHGAASYGENFNPTYTGPRNFVPQGLTNVKGIAFTCDFEATLGIAVSYDDPNSWHKVFTLTNPDRVVIDIYSY